MRLSVTEECRTRHTIHSRVRSGCRSFLIRSDISRIVIRSVSRLFCQPFVKHLLSFGIIRRKVFSLICVEVNTLVQVGHDFRLSCSQITRSVNKLAGIVGVNSLSVNDVSRFLTRNNEVTATLDTPDQFGFETGCILEFQFIRNIHCTFLTTFLGVFPSLLCYDFWFTRIVESVVNLHGVFPEFHLVIKFWMNRILTDKSVSNIARASRVTFINLQFFCGNCITSIS